MKRLALLLAFFGCRQIAGIGPVGLSDAQQGDTGLGKDGGNCSSGTPLFTSPSNYDNISATGGYTYFEAQGSGLYRCPAAGCSNAQTVAASAGGMSYVSFALGGTLAYYTLQSPAGDAGTTTGAIHSVNLDGTGDTTVATGLANPFWIAVSGTRIFWMSDPLILSGAGTGTVNCIGCSGTTSVAWITGLGTVSYALVADANQVYVVVDDGNTTGVTAGNAYACSTQTACGATPRKVTGGVFVSSLVTTGLIYPSSNGSLTSDGTYGYFVRNTDIIRVDGSGNIATIASGLNLSVGAAGGVAFDAALGNLYYNGDGTSVFRSKSDGSSASRVVCNQTGLTGLAVDSSSLYFLASGSGTSTNTFPFAAGK